MTPRTGSWSPIRVMGNPGPERTGRNLAGWRQGTPARGPDRTESTDPGGHPDGVQPRYGWAGRGPCRGDSVRSHRGDRRAVARQLGGAFVIAMPAETMCRAQQELEANARPETIAKIDSVAGASRAAWDRCSSRCSAAETPGDRLRGWRRGRSRDRHRLVVRRVGSEQDLRRTFEGRTIVQPLVRGLRSPVPAGVERTVAAAPGADAASELTGEVPHYNVIAEIRGSELAGRVRGPVGAPGLLARRKWRDRQRYGHADGRSRRCAS